jgi:hypothetical protein
MHKSWLCLSVVILLLAACTQGKGGLQIVQAQVLDGTDCTVPGTPTTKQRTTGTLDVELPGIDPHYSLPLLVANNLSSSSGSTSFDTNDMTLTHFTVGLSAKGVTWLTECPATFDTPGLTYRLAPGTTAGFSLDVLTPWHSRCLLPDERVPPVAVTATIWAKGLHQGTDVASSPFVFSIRVCAGCLQQGYDDPAFRVYEYPQNIPLCASLAGPNPYRGDPCAPGQDALILCCAVATTVNGTTHYEFACPGVFTGTPVPDASVPIDS